MSPDIIYKNKFIYNWHIGEKDYNDYMSRKEAVTKQKNILEPDFFDVMANPDVLDKFEIIKMADESLESEYDYFCYMRNEEKSDGIFDSHCDKLTEEQINKYREYEKISREEGCPKYIGVMSFNNDFLRENNLIVGEKINLAAVKSAARKGMNALVANSKKLDAANCYWSASVHTNTDNIHVHFQLLEYHRLEDRVKKYRDGDMIKIKAMEALKSAVAAAICPNKILKPLSEYERETVKMVHYAFESDERKIEKLIAKLPENHSWQYNRLNKQLRNEIDSCVRSVISGDKAAADMFEKYMRSLNTAQERFRKNYGDNSHYDCFTESHLHGRDGFYSRAGNAFLKICRQYQAEKAQAENKAAESGYPSEKESVSFAGYMDEDITPEFDYEYTDGDIPPEIDFAAYPNDDYQSGYPSEKESNIEEEQSKDENYQEKKEAEKETNEQKETNTKAKTKVRTNEYILYKIGKRYLLEGDLKKASVYFTKAAENGHTCSEYYAGKLLIENGTPQEREKGIAYMKKVASKDFDAANYYLGMFYAKNQDFQKAEHYLKISADRHNNSYAQYQLGRLYLSKEKLKEAEKYLGLAARNNNPGAQLVYGLLLQNQGKRKEAAAWIERSSKNGNEFAAKILTNNAHGDISGIASRIAAQSVAQTAMISRMTSAVRRAIGDAQAKTAHMTSEAECDEQRERARKEQNEAADYKSI